MPQYCKNCYKEMVNPLVKDEDLIYSTDELVCDNCKETRHLVISDDSDKLTENKDVEIQEQVIEQPQIIEPEDVMTEAECCCDTQKHIEMVRKFIRFMTDKLTQRGVDHDSSKLESPEVELLAKYNKILWTLTYGSDEYNQNLENLKPALEHHYSVSRHHPEHFANGITDMTLIDIMEMLCDWKAAAMRQNDGNLLKSVERNAARFKISGQLKQILINTARMLDEQEIK